MLLAILSFYQLFSQDVCSWILRVGMLMEMMTDDVVGDLNIIRHRLLSFRFYQVLGTTGVWNNVISSTFFICDNV